MPRPGPRRPLIAFRSSESGLAWIDAEAEVRGVSRSEMIRVMLAFAAQRMPRTMSTIDSKSIAVEN